jgi:hypothetical protein
MLQHFLNSVFSATLFSLLTMAIAPAQNPPVTGDPYGSRGNPISPDGKYKWIVRTTDSIHYELVELSSGRVIVTVSAYYSDTNNSNIRYAKGCGIFWNNDGTLVALDELNRRRAGHLYFYDLRNGMMREVRSTSLVLTPPYAVEGRLIVDPGWLSGTKIRVRQELKTKTGEFVSRHFTIDFANPSGLKIQNES